jgi:hypothetical protein
VVLDCLQLRDNSPARQYYDPAAGSCRVAFEKSTADLGAPCQDSPASSVCPLRSRNALRTGLGYQRPGQRCRKKVTLCLPSRRWRPNRGHPELRVEVRYEPLWHCYFQLESGESLDFAQMELVSRQHL